MIIKSVSTRNFTKIGCLFGSCVCKEIQKKMNTTPNTSATNRKTIIIENPDLVKRRFLPSASSNCNSISCNSSNNKNSNSTELIFEGWTIDNKGYYTMLGEPSFIIPKDIFTKLYSHQRVGVEWLYKIFNSVHGGGLLADDMGLGKTCQVCAFIGGLFISNKAKSAIIVLPVVVREYWHEQIMRWVSCALNIIMLHGKKKERGPKLRKFIDLVKEGNENCIMLTTYDTLKIHIGEISLCKVDIIVADEAQNIKNHNSGKSIAIRKISSKCRIAITGTPIPNNVMELWAIYDWICGENLVGAHRNFQRKYALPIAESLARDSDSWQKQQGHETSLELQKLIDPYYLRRTKDELMTVSSSAELSTDGMVIGQKNVIVVWLSLGIMQQRLYEAFLKSPEVQAAMTECKCAFAAIEILRRACCHYVLSKGFASIESGLEKYDNVDEVIQDFKQRWREAEDKKEKELERLENDEDIGELIDSAGTADEVEVKDLKSIISKMTIKQIISGSSKLSFMRDLVISCVADGKRVLILSGWTSMLDLAERIISTDLLLKYRRIDGKTAHSDRPKFVSEFNGNEDIKVFLVSTGAGGVGLTLNGASRVILLDPSWNPASDDQASDRCYRIGQKKNVIVYKLICCGTIEEKIYAKQVFKKGISRSVQDNSNQYRYFEKNRLSELLATPKDFYSSVTQEQLEKIHKGQRKIYPGLEEELERTSKLRHVVGLSDHDRLYTVEADDFEPQINNNITAPAVEMLYDIDMEEEFHDRFPEDLFFNYGD